MSKLIDRLNRIARPDPEPMGFRIGALAPARPKLLLIARLNKIDADKIAEQAGGADAVLLDLDEPATAAKLQKIARSLPDLPWGMRLGGESKTDAAALVKAGADFVVFPADSPLLVTGENGTGKILQVEPTLNEGLLRTANNLPVDAVLVVQKNHEGQALTWRQLMVFQRFAGLLEVPLLVDIPENVSADELQLLLEAGVDGVVTAANPAGLRKLIDGLNHPPRHKRCRLEAVVPRLSEEAPAVVEEEEDGDE